jgi:hypothetical protein
VILLVNPPVTVPSEPPPGIARLAGTLTANGVRCSLIDANVEGILHLLGLPGTATDTWTRRALKNAGRNVERIRDQDTYRIFDRYVRTVMDLNRALSCGRAPEEARITLTDFQTAPFSPLKSTDLIRAAEHPEVNPFNDYLTGPFSSRVEALRPSIVGFSLNYLSQAVTTFAMAGFVRKRFPGVTIVIGGGLVTSWASSLDGRNPFAGLIDRLVPGPGEGPLLALSGATGTGATGTGATEAPPDYGSLPLSGYLSPGLILPFSASAGCYWGRCAFCPERAEGNPFRGVGPRKAMQDLEILAERYEPALVHLVDNAIPPAVLKEIGRKGMGRPWYGFVRATAELADGDFCRVLRRSGCVMLKLGIESGDQAVLDGMEKGLAVETSSRVLRALREAGIAAYVYLLFGTPYEAEAEARKTLDFVCRHHEMITFLNVAIFNLPVHAPEAKSLATGPFYEGDLSLYSGFIHPRGWNRSAVRRFIDREFRRHSLIQPILRRDPPVFSSLHAPFLVAARCSPSSPQSRQG